MHVLVRAWIVALGATVPMLAQTACSPAQLTTSAQTVATLRRELHRAAVPASGPAIPTPVASRLGALQDALALFAKAAFACAAPTVAPEALQTTLATALHANLAPSESTVETRGKQDIGAYGSDLAVQVFELFGKPRLLEVTFRYGLECGDDNLVLVFESAADGTTPTWHQQLRWGASHYNTVADAFGDFILLTPLSGDPKHPHWRYLAAHGHPACSDTPHPSTFDLDLLTPTDDPAHPTLAWHFSHGYTQGNVIPRLTTTEDTIDFRLNPVPATDTAKAATPPAPGVYRFRLLSNGAVEPSAAPPATADPTTPSNATTTH